MGMYNEFRPETFDDIFGQDNAVNLFKSILKLPFEKRPKVFLLAGASGSGKTCIARIYASKMGVNPDGMDFRTLDGGKDRSIDRIRSEAELMGTNPMNRNADCRVYYIDESHQLLKASQEALLKVCEDVPPKTTVIFATTEPERMGKALKSRCKVVTINALSNKDMALNMVHVSKKADIKISTDDIKKLVLASDGNTRTSIQLLENYKLNGGDADKAVAMVDVDKKMEADVRILCQGIIKSGARWDMVKSFMQTYKGQHEQVRQAIMAYLRACVLNSNKMADRQRFNMLLECFLQPFYGSEESGLVYQLANAWDLK